MTTNTLLLIGSAAVCIGGLLLGHLPGALFGAFVLALVLTEEE